MNILYIGPYRDGTGWSEASKRIILSLNTTDINLVVRPIRYNNFREKLPREILSLESREHLKNYDVIIQNALPHNFEYYGPSKNIGMWWTESNSFLPTTWPQRINMMDSGIVFNLQMIKAAKNSGVKIPLHECIIAHYDPLVYNKDYPKLNMPILKDKFIFYNIAEFNKRKNFGNLLIAFHTEFDPHEDVELVIKTNMDIKPYCDRLKYDLKLYSSLDYYKEEIIIHNRLSQEEIYGLHQMADCFVSPSFGEGLCIPAMDASCFGNQVIATDLDGIRSGVLVGTKEYYIRGRTEPCNSMVDTFSDYMTAHDTWNSPSVMDVRRAMRKAFEFGKKKSRVEFNRSFEMCGKKLMEAIDA